MARPSATGNYARAGKAVADDATYSLDVARTYSPKADEMVRHAAKLRGQENIAAIKASEKVASAGIAQSAKTKAYETELDAKQELRGAKRKAGMLAAAGKFLGTGIGGLAPSGREKREVGAGGQALLEREQEARAKAEELKNTPLPNLLTSSSSGNTATTGYTGTSSSSSNTASDGWDKLSKVLRTGEGTLGESGYTTQFTGTQFSDMSAHPRQIRSANGLSSDAAGAYQFLSTTWDEAKNALNLPDFSPASQEKAGRFLTERRGVNPDQVYTTKEEFKAVMDKLAPEWASMPYSGKGVNGGGYGSSYYGQGGISLDEAWNIYNQ